MITNLIDMNIDGTLVPNGEIYTIKPFSEYPPSIRNSELHLKELAYIYWVGVIGSPYFSNINSNDREDYNNALYQVKNEVNLPDNWEANSLVLRCIDKWKFLQETPTLSALEAIKSSLVGIKNYLNNVNINERIESGAKKGELVHNPSTISKLGKELLGLQDSYEQAKKKVISEYREKMKMRGGGNMGALEND
jgi:hypothetical protein